ncbi:MAG: ABC transporter permease [Rhodocyclaceae bacterium]
MMTALTSLSPRLRQRLLSGVAIVMLFVVWEAVCVGFGISNIVLPRPSEIFIVLVQKLPLLWPHAMQTLYTTLLGFALGTLAGVLIGALIGVSRLAYDVAYPILVGFSSIPKVAVVPIFVVWFGAGTVPAVLTSMVICMFPVVVNVATGLAHTEPELQDVLKVLGARKLDILWNVGLPRTLPYLFASLKIALTLAFVGTVLSETVAANKGIGNMMMIASGNFDVPLVFAGLFILAAMGVALYALSALLERRMTGWAQRGNDIATV